MSLFPPVGGIILSAFGEDAKVIPSVGSPFDITVVFDSRHVAVDHGMEAPVSEKETTFGFRKSDAPNIKRGDRIEARDNSYVVRDLQPDGEDWTIAFVEIE